MPGADDPPRRHARQGLDAQRLGLVVRGLPRRAPAAGRVREDAARCRSTASTTRTSATTRSGWLARFGNPYDASLFDDDGRVGIDFGVYGVPETFVIDKQRRDPHEAHRPADARGAARQDRAAAEEARCLSTRRRLRSLRRALAAARSRRRSPRGAQGGRARWPPTRRSRRA